MHLANISTSDAGTKDQAALRKGSYAELATILTKVWLVKSTKTAEFEYSDAEEDTSAIPEAAVKGGAASVHAR